MEKIKVQKAIFRIMLVLLILCTGVLAYAIYKSYENVSEPFFSLCIAATFTTVVHLMIIAFATIIIKKGPVGLLYPLIPVFGYYYLLYSVFVELGGCLFP